VRINENEGNAPGTTSRHRSFAPMRGSELLMMDTTLIFRYSMKAVAKSTFICAQNLKAPRTM
jgi:hypothetical protein